MELGSNLTYEEESVAILDQRDQVLRTKVIPLVKVLWWNRIVEGATWEAEQIMRIKYPHLFQIGKSNFGDEIPKDGKIVRPNTHDKYIIFVISIFTCDMHA